MVKVDISINQRNLYLKAFDCELYIFIFKENFLYIVQVHINIHQKCLYFLITSLQMHFSIHNDNLYIAYFLELREVLAIQIKKLENYEEL